MRNLEQRIDAALRQEIRPGEPGVAIALAKDGELIFRKGYGLANVEWDIPMPPDGVFPIASLTKQFTAVAIMMLKERGLVSLDAPLTAYLPDLSPMRRVTVRHLLNHTSGIGNYSESPEFRRDTARLNSPLTGLVQLIASLPVDSEPGERYRYGNSGYVLLGAIIEHASGAKYRDFLKREIFDPLGMSNTAFRFDERIVPKRVAGYQRGRNGIENASYISPSFFHAAGALASTVDDLAIWDRAMRASRLIDSRSLAEMLTPTRLAAGSEYPYGFGYGTGSYRGFRLYHHTGGINGFTSHMLHLRDAGLTTIVLSNRYLFPVDRVTRLLLRCALDLPDTAVPERVESERTGALTGVFQIGPLQRELIITEGRFAFADQPGTLLDAGSDRTLFETDDPETSYRFSELRDNRYQRMEALSPLWPPQRYERVT